MESTKTKGRALSSALGKPFSYKQTLQQGSRLGRQQKWPWRGQWNQDPWPQYAALIPSACRKVSTKSYEASCVKMTFMSFKVAFPKNPIEGRSSFQTWNRNDASGGLDVNRQMPTGRPGWERENIGPDLRASMWRGNKTCPPAPAPNKNTCELIYSFESGDLSTSDC